MNCCSKPACASIQSLTVDSTILDIYDAITQYDVFLEHRRKYRGCKQWGKLYKQILAHKRDRGYPCMATAFIHHRLLDKWDGRWGVDSEENGMRPLLGKRKAEKCSGRRRAAGLEHKEAEAEHPTGVSMEQTVMQQQSSTPSPRPTTIVDLSHSPQEAAGQTDSTEVVHDHDQQVLGSPAPDLVEPCSSSASSDGSNVAEGTVGGRASETAGERANAAFIQHNFELMEQVEEEMSLRKQAEDKVNELKSQVLKLTRDVKTVQSMVSLWQDEAAKATADALHHEELRTQAEEQVEAMKEASAFAASKDRAREEEKAQILKDARAERTRLHKLLMERGAQDELTEPETKARAETTKNVRMKGKKRRIDQSTDTVRCEEQSVAQRREDTPARHAEEEDRLTPPDRSLRHPRRRVSRIAQRIPSRSAFRFKVGQVLKLTREGRVTVHARRVDKDYGDRFYIVTGTRRSSQQEVEEDELRECSGDQTSPDDDDSEGSGNEYPDMSD